MRKGGDALLQFAQLRAQVGLVVSSVAGV
jgi:hypothetical protein